MKAAISARKDLSSLLPDRARTGASKA